MSRRPKRSNARIQQDERTFTKSNSNVVSINQYRRPLKQKVVLLPKNLAQESYIEALENPNINIVFATGPAGTGKTMLSTLYGLKLLNENLVDKIVITRPAISVDEQHGFLPGNLVEKMQPWVLPILDYFYQYYSKKDVLSMVENDIIEIAPLAYMRGRTFVNSWIIGDEMQNATPNQMKMLCTRIGNGSRLIVTGDITQYDRGYDNNGLKDILSRYTTQPGIAVCKFNDKDVERHPIIETILNMYGDEK